MIIIQGLFSQSLTKSFRIKTRQVTCCRKCLSISGKRSDSYDAAKGRLFTWMLNIARNASIDKLRSKGYRDNQQNQPMAESESSGMAMSTNPTVNDVGLKKVLTTLNEEYRKLIDLSYFQGFTHEEIAKMMGIPLGTVKTRIRTAISQLRTMIR